MAPVLKAVLKRGALVTAANWEVIVIQFLAESAFKALLLVPVVGAAFLLALLVGGSFRDALARDPRDAVGLVIAVLDERPAALAAYLAGLLVVIVGGSVLMFIVKGGTVAVLVDAERHAPAVEHPPLRMITARRAARFSLEAFLEGIDELGPRLVRLGLLLLLLYGGTALAYLIVVVGAYRILTDAGLALAATLVATVASVILVLWLAVVNLFYVLAQLTLATGERRVRGALRQAIGLVRREGRLVGGIFLVVLALAVLATVASILATALLGFVGFVPVIGIVVLPLQLFAWLGRGLLFEFLGLASLVAYASVLGGVKWGDGGVDSRSSSFPLCP